MAHQRQPLRQPVRRMAAALRRQDGAGLRPPRRQHRRQSCQRASPRAAEAHHHRTTAKPKLAAGSAVLGASIRMRDILTVGLDSRLQGNYRANQRANIHRSDLSGGHSTRSISTSTASPTATTSATSTPPSPSSAAKRKRPTAATAPSTSASPGTAPSPPPIPMPKSKHESKIERRPHMMHSGDALLSRTAAIFLIRLSYVVRVNGVRTP